MKFREVIKMLEKNDIDHKMVNEELYIYMNGYTRSKPNTTYLWLGTAIENDEENFYEEFELSDNFEIGPNDLEAWVNIFVETGTHTGYNND